MSARGIARLTNESFHSAFELVASYLHRSRHRGFGLDHSDRGVVDYARDSSVHPARWIWRRSKLRIAGLSWSFRRRAERRGAVDEVDWFLRIWVGGNQNDW